ncbi:IS1595 family transposase [Paenibacillus antri]|uniref:IS1595 family transposase n=1 Tax=Paenibacillus antri TaxID=2582848 RepID=A0A5R9G6H6_9BACL|nr:transposase [Paenibacillus antri]TLS49710.1 IS1595 family transposase [Paenibacillus antri]
MDQAEQAAYFFRRRWPNGFSCPSCGYGAYYTIATRQLPLYECRLCGHQTSVTAGTVMAKTRTPLAKWAAAIELLASTNGVNAKRLAALIDVKHKTAWRMLRKFRQAIGEVEDAFKLQGTVHTGLHFLAPKYIFIFLPHRHYRCERVVSVSASVGRDGKPTALKLGFVPRDRLVPRFKEPTAHGKARILEEHVDPSADVQWLNSDRMHHSPLRDCLLEARGWMNRLFRGVGTKYLQGYLDEFCFRWNAASRGKPPREAWDMLCFPSDIAA